MSQKELTQKEKAKLYENWLKFVDGKGYTEIFAEPQKIKEKLDKLNKEVESQKGTGIILSKENQNLIRQKRVLEEELQIERKKIEELSKPRETWDEKFAREAEEKSKKSNEK